jgi:tRNA (guanine-N7-)-methyltransferase
MADWDLFTVSETGTESDWEWAKDVLTPPLVQGIPCRVRNHVNPFNAQYQASTVPPNWEQVYSCLDRPLHLDIGTGSGRFLLAMAKQCPDWNFLGIEIRKPLVDRANQWREQLGLQNVCFLFGNINVSARTLFAPSDLARVSIQFPDPWFKKRHQKRRVVQPKLVSDLALLMQPGSTLFLQSDILAVATEMKERFLAHGSFRLPDPDPLPQTIFGIPTERELQCLRLNLPIYRYRLFRQ